MREIRESRRSCKCRRGVLSLLTSLLLFAGVPAAPLPAQGPVYLLRVRVVDSLSNNALAGVLVAITDSAAAAVGHGVLADPAGQAVLTPPGAGPWRVLVRRIGYTPFTSAPLMASTSGQPAVIVRVPTRRVALPAVRVVARRDATCEASARSPSADAAPVWADVRTALEASALTRDTRLVSTEAMAIEQHVDLSGRLVRADTFARGRSGERPFPAAPAADLERGYVQGSYVTAFAFYAPDERALLSDAFTRQHCITLAHRSLAYEDGTLVGLTFTPRTARTHPDIAGTIWVDSATSELRRIEFTYVQLDLPVRAADLGGSVRFAHTARGAWLIAGWSLRLPHWHSSNLERSGFKLDGYTELRGVAVVRDEVAALAPDVPRVITGQVVDSLSSRPLAGARVMLPALARDVTTDATGRFRFDNVGVGRFAVRVARPGLEPWPGAEAVDTVDLVGRATAEVSLVTPAFLTLWRRLGCADVPGTPGAAPGGGMIAGRVVDALFRKPVSGARVSGAWSDTGRTVVTDRAGRFVLCGVPHDQLITLTVADSVQTAGATVFRLGSDLLTARTIAVASPVAMGLLDGDTAAAPQPLRAGSGSAVTGRVTDAVGMPVRDARVYLAGFASEVTTGQDGRFFLRGVPDGARVLRAQAVGYVPVRALINAHAGDSAVVTMTLARLTTLAAVTIRERERVDNLRFELDQRRRAGLGVYTDSLMLAGLAGTWQAFSQSYMEVVQGRGSFTILFTTTNARDPRSTKCIPQLYVDGLIADHDQLAQMPKDQIALIESYHPATRAPLRYSGSGSLNFTGTESGICGVILVWTKSAVRLR